MDKCNARLGRGFNSTILFVVCFITCNLPQLLDPSLTLHWYTHNFNFELWCVRRSKFIHKIKLNRFSGTRNRNFPCCVVCCAVVCASHLHCRAIKKKTSRKIFYANIICFYICFVGCGMLCVRRSKRRNMLLLADGESLIFYQDDIKKHSLPSPFQLAITICGAEDEEVFKRLFLCLAIRYHRRELEPCVSFTIKESSRLKAEEFSCH